MKNDLIFTLLSYSDRDLAILLNKYGYNHFSRDFFKALRMWLFQEIQKPNELTNSKEWIVSEVKKFINA